MPGPALPVWATNFTPGQFDTAAAMNTIGQNGTFLLNPPLFVAYQNTVQGIPNNAWTALSLDVTLADTYGGHSNTVNNSQYTCQSNVPGWYTAAGVVALAANSGNFRGVRITVNATPVIGTGVYSQPNSSGEMGVATPTKDIFLNAGDIVRLEVYQAFGGTLNTQLDADLRTSMYLRYSHA